MKLMQIMGLSLALAVSIAGSASANDNTASSKAKSHAKGSNIAVTATQTDTYANRYSSLADSAALAVGDGNFAVGLSNSHAYGRSTDARTSTRTKAVGGEHGYAESKSAGSAESSSSD